MIVTVTVNPSVDRTIEVDRLTRGEVLRGKGSRLDPGGKGINVARALAAHGRQARAVVTVGGAEGAQLLTLLEGSGVETVPVTIARAIRSNITVVEPDGTTTKLNEPGATLDRAELEALLDVVTRAAAQAEWVVLSGSLPPGVPTSLYRDLVHLARDGGAACAVDTSGPALGAAVEAGPLLVKPNREELAELTGRPLERLGDAVDAARLVLARLASAHEPRPTTRGPRHSPAVLASLGADGALLVDADGVRHARARMSGPPRSSVGAGDALLAGFLAGGGVGPQALAHAVAWGAAAVTNPGSRMPGPGDVRLDRVEITDRPDHTRRLTDAGHENGRTVDDTTSDDAGAITPARVS